LKTPAPSGRRAGDVAQKPLSGSFSLQPQKGDEPMYSPKIKEELIPQLYQIKKETGRTMTKLVDSML
jgi:hypothetical protein